MSKTQPPILSLKNVGKTFEVAGGRIEALRGASLDVARGEFVCLIGASGCGKSTLLRIVAGFETATTGAALMWGLPIDGPGPSRGMVFQDYGLFPWLTVRGNIGFGPASRGRPAKEVKDTVDTFIDLVGLGRFADADAVALAQLAVDADAHQPRRAFAARRRRYLSRQGSLVRRIKDGISSRYDAGGSTSSNS